MFSKKEYFIIINFLQRYYESYKQNSVQKVKLWLAITDETNRGPTTGLLFKLKNYKPYDFYKSGSAMPENKRFSVTNKIETT